jgi:2-polyprenyl-3-methyl-5-hydroxy-6-metoxy-1,4-benzoquinol methylase
MYTKEQIQQELEALKLKYGEWNFDIPLPFGIWTKGNQGVPQTRLRKIVQIVNDLSRKPISESRILDLGCSDGMFSIEFALHGAETIGVEAREANIKKAIFGKDVLNLKNLEFRQDDIRKISLASYGKFDAIICSGVFYHLPAIDAINLIKTIYEMVDRLLVLDVRVALEPIEKIVHNKEEYWGTIFQEHPVNATAEEKEKRLFYSIDNMTSFWFTRPSLINLLNKAGFSSIYECFTPAHMNFGKPGIHHLDHLTLVAIKGEISELKTSPDVNELRENFPEGSLSYAPEKPGSLYKKALSKLKEK